MILENGEEEVDAISELISEINGFGSKYNNNNIYNNIYVYIYLWKLQIQFTKWYYVIN